MIDWKQFTGFELAEAPEEQLREQLRGVLSEILDEDYRSFIEAHDGGEGFIGDSYLVLDSIENSLATLDRARHYGPSFFPFGGDGGDGLYVFDTATVGWPVLMLPLTSASSEDIRQVASGFRGFIDKLASG